MGVDDLRVCQWPKRPLTGEWNPMKVMTQKWQNLLFAHWSYEPDEVRALLPPHLEDLGVELDCYEGKAYIGLVPFQMRDLRIRGLPRIPSTSDFGEVNVRTYVTCQGRPAVWFFSLDTDRLLPTLVARLAFRLPYCYGQASVSVTGQDEGSIVASQVERRWPNHVSSAIAARIGPPIETSPLDAFLTARWGLVTTSTSPAREGARDGRPTWFGAVDHEPWPLHSAGLVDLDDDLVLAAGLSRPEGDPILAFSPGVTTSIHSLERIRD